MGFPRCGKKLNVHPLLKDLHEDARCCDKCCGTDNCSGEIEACCNHAGCGDFMSNTSNNCPMPCKHCHVWDVENGDELAAMARENMLKKQKEASGEN